LLGRSAQIGSSAAAAQLQPRSIAAQMIGPRIPRVMAQEMVIGREPGRQSSCVRYDPAINSHGVFMRPSPAR
jgi:hypothetical protein